ncbi:MAG: S9 family peptidase [Armatimonadetes bacterium]|nr:S9 family peptidase [Armatimonadota bacterium]MDE2207229.1 S9 family peptidase [Armatimonadota bacterium]
MSTQQDEGVPAPTEGGDSNRLRITPRALLEAPRLSDPQFHPDGHRIAFVVSEPDFNQSSWLSHIWITEWLEDGVDDEEPPPTPDEELPDPPDSTRQLTFSREGERNPRWSPDGRYLAFISTRLDPTEHEPEHDEEVEDPHDQIWVLPTDGGEAVKITSAPEGVLDFVWHPDCSSLLFVAAQPRPPAVDAVRRHDERQRRIDAVVEHEDRLRREVWRVSVDDKRCDRLFTGDFGIEEIDVSPDGTRICYTTNYTGDGNDYHLIDVWVWEAESGEHRRLLERNGAKYHPRWSPDGRNIAFTGPLDANVSFSRESLFVVRAPSVEGGEDLRPCRLMTPAGFDCDVLAYEWSLLDASVVVVAATGASTGLFRLDPDLHALTEGDLCEIEGFCVDPGSNVVAFVAHSATALDELYLVCPDGSRLCLTSLNRRFSETYAPPQMELLHWHSADGTPVEGVVTWPNDMAPAQRYPLVLQLHGGPKGRSALSMRDYLMHAVWAAHGYIVLRPNYRGSEGYGAAFCVANQRDLGGGDYADIMAGVSHVLERGVVDANRMAVMGGSYGGYLTNWIIGHTDRFRAAVSLFGVFHLMTDFSNSTYFRWDYDYLGAAWWEDPEIYRRLSPGTYVDRMQTPTLIIHGDEDDVTSISNSRELYRALRERGIATQFVHYPREGHGLGEPNHRLDELRRCLAWTDRHLHGGNATLYQIGDRVPNTELGLELRVVSATHTEVPGWQPSIGGEAAPELLEVAFTISAAGPRDASAGYRVLAGEINLACDDTSHRIAPKGIVTDSPGGKLLLTGDALVIERFPDGKTGALAVAISLAFDPECNPGELWLHVPEFPPVWLAWDGVRPDGSGDNGLRGR